MRITSQTVRRKFKIREQKIRSFLRLVHDPMSSKRGSRPIGVCLVSDFFYPSVGGVELHIYHIGTQLIKRGFHVIVITHCEIDNPQRHGVRYLTGGLKVYYLPEIVIYGNVILPILVGNFPVVRKIFIRESIDIVHGHQASNR